MHFLLRFLVVSSLAHTVLAQPRLNDPAHCVRINRLVIESNSLSTPDRERITRLLREKSYPEGEIGERIRQAVKSVGYFKASVDEPKLTFPTKGRDIANVTVKMNPGAQYRLGEIHFQGSTLFSPDQLRNVFSLRRSDLFNATEFAVGLENLRQLYGTRGYVNMTATPIAMTDEPHHTINLFLDLEAGQAYDFGKLSLEGVEPHPGDSQALFNAWKPLQGRRYNPVELQHWLLANHFDSKASAPASDSIKTAVDLESRVVNVTLTQWPK